MTTYFRATSPQPCEPMLLLLSPATDDPSSASVGLPTPPPAGRAARWRVRQPQEALYIDVCSSGRCLSRDEAIGWRINVTQVSDKGGGADRDWRLNVTQVSFCA